MKTSSKLFQFFAFSLVLNAVAVAALHAAEPSTTPAATKPAGVTNDTNDGACGCDDDEESTPVVKITEAVPVKKKTAKVTVSTTTKVTNTKADGNTSKETTRAKYVNGELVSGSTTSVSGNENVSLARPVIPAAPASPATQAPETK